MLEQLGVREAMQDSQRFLNEGKIFKRWELKGLNKIYHYIIDEGGFEVIDQHPYDAEINGLLLLGPKKELTIAMDSTIIPRRNMIFAGFIRNHFKVLDFETKIRNKDIDKDIGELLGDDSWGKNSITWESISTFSLVDAQIEVRKKIKNAVIRWA